MNGYIVYNTQTNQTVVSYVGGEQTTDEILSLNGHDSNAMGCVRFTIDEPYSIEDYTVINGSAVRAPLTPQELKTRRFDALEREAPFLVELLLDEINTLRTEAGLPARTRDDMSGRAP